MLKRLMASLCLIILYLTTNAQKGEYAQIEGVVFENNTSKVLEHAVVSILPQDVYVTTNTKGEFVFNKVNLGKINIRIHYVGMETVDTIVNILKPTGNKFTFVMRTESLRLNDVVVIGVQNKAGQSTSSIISRQAMDHYQANTLSDLMQLLPGESSRNPNMNTPNIITLRTLNGSSGNSGDIANSLGTSIIVDGFLMSNNANLQTFAPTINGLTSMPGLRYGYANGGIDTRILSLDNIESVEVIRGVPSVEYGDLTSGLVVVKSRAGKSPINVRFKMNPQTYQGSISKGLYINEGLGTINLSGDYLHHTKDATESYAYYQRFNLKALWTTNFSGNLYSNTSIDLIYGKDTRNLNPDDIRSRRANSAYDLGIRFNTNGVWSIGRGWLRSIDYNLSGSYSYKHSWEEQLLGNAISPYSTSKTDGAIISNRPGQQVYDSNGKEITNIPDSERNSWATFLPNEYFSRKDIYGKEINANAKVKANFIKSWGNITNHVVLGIDYKTDGNVGDGIIFDEHTPPYRTFIKNSSQRVRAYKDIPFINQLGVFVEDKFRFTFDERVLNVTAGMRFDYVNKKSLLVPRVNASFDLVPRLFTVRAGYGVAAKAPTLLYLYPENAYFDYINFNGLNAKEPNERLLVNTTRVFNAENSDLELAKNRTLELGFDFKFNKYRVSVTAYDQKMKNGYSLSPTIETFKLVPFTQYKIAQKVPGQIPVLEVDKTENVFSWYATPTNNIYLHDRGIEFEIDLGKVDALNTSFYIDGAWRRTSHRNQGHTFSTRENITKNTLERYIGIYEKGVATNERERFLTKLKTIHHIPKIGFLITLTTEVSWFEKYWTVYKNDTIFQKYISHVDGKVYDFDPAKKDDPEFSYLKEDEPDTRFVVTKYKPTLFFNLNLSKEIGNFLTASFYVNNVFYSNPLQNLSHSPGSYIVLGENIYFGFELKFNIK